MLPIDTIVLDAFKWMPDALAVLGNATIAIIMLAKMAVCFFNVVIISTCLFLVFVTLR